MYNVRANLIRVEERIREAAMRAGREREDIKLVAVTKTVPVEVMLEAIEAGVTAIGENRVQEAYQKYQLIGKRVEWHLIGHLQSNKAKRAVEIFDLIHSVDSLHIAQEIHRHAIKMGKVQDILIEVNVAGEESKFGVSPSELPQLLREVASLDGIKVRGLMTVAPIADDPADVRPYFAQLRRLAEELREEGIERTKMDYLSMGMSGDFEVAVEEGANIVRIGSAIFGKR